MPWLREASDGARKQWFQWRIISPDRMIERSSQDHPYSAIHRYEWLEKCRQKALAAGVNFQPEPASKQVLQILDSRPPSMKDGVMLQHFSGYEITADRDVFDSTTAGAEGVTEVSSKCGGGMHDEVEERLQILVRKVIPPHADHRVRTPVIDRPAPPTGRH